MRSLLTKAHLFTQQDFKALFAAAEKKHGRFFVLFYRSDSGCELSSLGIVVSKNNAKTSVRRNLVKRLVREHFRLAQHELFGLKIMLVAKNTVHKATKEMLTHELQQLFVFLKKQVQVPGEQAKL